MIFLGAEETRATAIAEASVVADAMPRATLGLPDGRLGLAIDESFDRAWRRVGLALDRVGFTVEDRGRSQGRFYVRYIDPDADARARQSSDKGFLKRLFSFGGDEDQEAKPGTEYRVRVEGDYDGAEVTVLSAEGGVDSSSSARQILELLEEQLR